MANLFINVLKQKQIEFYIAPYEADAQLTHFYLTGRIQAVITEDSDLLPFGVKTCFFKMDVLGNGDSINLDDISNNTDFNFQNFDQDKILTMCILSGCDYLDSIKGIGFKKAFKLVHEHGDDIGAILRKIRREGKLIIPQNYEQDFEKAFLTFKFQLVYCPIKKELIHLNEPASHPLGPLLSNYQNLDFLG